MILFFNIINNLYNLLFIYYISNIGLNRGITNIYLYKQKNIYINITKFCLKCQSYYYLIDKKGEFFCNILEINI